MPSIIQSYEYDIFISYRHNDNRSGWVTEFVNALQEELAATIKEPLTIYFDKNPHDGLLETHNVDKSLEGKLKCLIFIPIISQTYCDQKSFAWQHEFVAFNKLAQEDSIGRDITLSHGNVGSRILPIKIHELDAEDTNTIEKEIGGVLRAIEFIYKEAGVNRPLTPDDSDEKNINSTKYKNQVNKVANAIKEIISALKNPTQATNPKPKSPTPTTQYTTPNSSNKKILIGSLLFLMLVSIAYYFYQRQTTTSDQPILDKSIAVLPFENFISGSADDYFADGLTEEILNVLAKTPDLNVASRTSSFQYKGKHGDARKIASELGVAHILEGSVRGSGERMRITAQLIRASDGFHLWSETYDKTKDDVIQIQEDIALKIAIALKTAMDPEALAEMAQSGTQNIEAYNYYLKGLAATDDFEKSYHNFEKARALDSTFAEAHYRASNFWKGQLAITATQSNLTDKSYQDKIKLFNERITLAILYADPIDKLKYQGVQSLLQMQFRKAYTYLKTYLNERPNDFQSRRNLIQILIYLGEFGAAAENVRVLTKSALQNDWSYSLIVNSYFHARMYSEGALFAQKTLKEFPDSEELLYQTHRILLWNGMIKEARHVANTYSALVHDSEILHVLKLRQACAEGDSVLAYSIYKSEAFKDNNRLVRSWLGLMFLGRNEEAQISLQPLVESGDLVSLFSWLYYPSFDPKQFPQLQNILEREEAKPRTLIEIPFALKSKITK